DSIITPTETFKKLLVFLDSKTGKTIVLDGINSEIQRYINKLYKVDVLKEFEQFKGIYVPLREGTYIEPPPFQEFWDMKKLRNVIFDNITGSTKRRLNRYLKSRTFDDGEKEYIIISIPIRTGQRGMVGILLSDFKKNIFAMKRVPIQHPLKKNKSQFEMIGLRVKRHDKDYLLNRTQGNNTLVDKKVTVIGLGSLGSRITFELARAGVSEFTLIDKDILDIDNIYRHELGVTNLYWKGKDRYYNISKVEALMLELHERFPALKIEYENADILDVIDEEFSLITNSDLVVVALGSPTEELYLNKVLYGLKDSPPTIYSWLDPLGIGGHALLTNNIKKQGCFQCLFTPLENSNEIVPNQASFASPNQYFAKPLAGCDSVFTVYGSMDALQTAIIATRLAVRVLNQEEEDNPLISWKGDSLELIKQGFKTSPRYEFRSEELFEYRYLYKRGKCPVCGVGENCDL
ncbi:thiamine biosynthesis protein ThiF, partial [Bacillus cereus]|uniref:ThiF family adenylyltransferase n=3 Tax=Bacillus TaxID=1386 RepID=UPI00065C1500